MILYDQDKINFCYFKFWSEKMSKERGRLIAEGKTKRVYLNTLDPTVVEIESKDDITAGDGAKHDLIEMKSTYANTTTCNCFQLLEWAGVPTHFACLDSENSFYAQRMEMIPIEIVVRRIAYGSYLKRNTQISAGTIFNVPVIEFFFKDDERHDPMIIIDFVGNRILYYEAGKPIATGYLNEEPISEFFQDFYKILPQLTNLAQKSFIALEKAWAKQGVSLVDLKIECGRDPRNMDIILVADVVDNDSWRIWPEGDCTQMKDKQVYRNLKKSDYEALEAIKKNYAEVAEMTNHFLE